MSQENAIIYLNESATRLQTIIIDNLVECFGLDNSLIEINTLKLRINDQAKIKYLELKNFGFILIY